MKKKKVKTQSCHSRTLILKYWIGNKAKQQVLCTENRQEEIKKDIIV